MTATENTMEAVIYGGPGLVTVERRPIPVLEADSKNEVVVKVLTTALCGSELHTYRGIKTFAPGFVMGHEYAGVVHASSCRAFKVGDHVVAPFTTSCGDCWYCQRGYSARCQKGKLFGSVMLDGAQAGYVKVPLAESTLFHAPPGLSLDLLVVMADILPTGYYASKLARATIPEMDKDDAVVVVIGCGPVGLCAVIAASEWVKKGNLYAIDFIQDRLDQAEQYGAISIPLSAEGPNSALEIVRASTGGRGADAVLEVVGAKSAFDLATELVRPFGFISSVGIHHAPDLVPGPIAYDKNLKLSFGRCPVQSVFVESLELLGRKKAVFEAGFVSDWMKLDEAPKAYELFNEGKVRKVGFRPHGEERQA